MIKYLGIKKIDKLSYLLLENTLGTKVEIPIDQVTADRINKYINKIALKGEEKLDRGNDELAD